MKQKKRALAAAAAAVIAVNGVLTHSMTIKAAAAKYEFEDAVITGDVTVKTSSSASNGSYLYMTESGTITLTVEAPQTDVYDLTFYAGGVGGSKQQNLSVNGVSQGSLSIPASDGFEPVKVTSIKLNAGANTIVIEKSWGWTNFDYMTMEAAVLPDITASDTTCVDPDAIPEANNLMSYMASIYGSHIISGQQEIYNYGPHGFEHEFEYLNDLTGHYPAIRGFDYGNFTCPAFGSDDGSTERVIDWVKNRGGIATASWHLNVPNDMASYNVGDKVDWAQTSYNAKDNDFSPKKVYEEGTKENQYYTLALEKLAAEFKKLEAEGIPVVWRPLHEAEGGGGESGSWFWWGKEGSAVYKELWRYTYDQLTNKYGCHNLIWTWNSYAFETSENWYPGDEYVDIIGYDKYNCTDWSSGSAKLVHNDSAIASTFYTIMQKYGSKKMVAMAENDCFSTVDNLVSEKAGWLYFMTWYDGGSDDINFLSNPVFNTEADTIAMYQSDYCITLDELPDDLYGKESEHTKGTTAETTTVTTTEPVVIDDAIMAQIEKVAGVTHLNFDRAVGDTIYLRMNIDSDVTYANGCVGTSVKVNGTDYWVQYQWVAEKSGDAVEIAVDLSTPFNAVYNNGEDTVEDAALLKQIGEAGQEQKSFQFQNWYTGAGEEAVDNSKAALVAAYLKDGGVTPGSTTTEKAQGETTTTTTAVVGGDNEVTGTFASEEGKTADGKPDGTFNSVFEFTPKPGAKTVTAYINVLTDDLQISGAFGTWNVTWLQKDFEVDVPEDYIAKVTYEIPENVGETVKLMLWWPKYGEAELVKLVYDEGDAPVGTTTTKAATTTKAQDTTTTTTTKAAETTTTEKQTGTKPSVDPSLYGDVNVDGVVDITDAVLLNKIIADVVKPSDQQRANGDTNNDGELSANDATNLLKFIVGAIKELPV